MFQDRFQSSPLSADRSWLPFLRGGGTLYPPSPCWHISFFLQAALNSLGFGLVIPAAAMMSCTTALAHESLLRGALVPAALHLAAASLVRPGSLGGMGRSVSVGPAECLAVHLPELGDGWP